MHLHQSKPNTINVIEWQSPYHVEIAIIKKFFQLFQLITFIKLTFVPQVCKTKVHPSSQ